MKFENTLEFASQADEQDILSHYREDFYIPVLNEKEVIYLSGNRMGLQPREAQDAVLDTLEDWASFGVEGYSASRNPWNHYHEKFPPLLTGLTGSLPEEVVVMNQYSANLHLMMSSFYRPARKRKKIICESNADLSDVFALKSQMALRGVSPGENLVQIPVRNGEFTVRNEDIIQTIREAGEELALVFLGGVNDYTGQVLFMKSIVQAAHEAGAMCGFDLSHAIGNIELKLHDWDVDFGCWSSHRYLNSGPGGLGGVFIHQRHLNNDSFRLQGIWGAKKETRLKMNQNFVPNPGAAGWQLNLAPVLSMAVHFTSLEIFKEAGFNNILKKGRDLSEYLLYVLGNILEQTAENPFRIITPMAPTQHGNQISILMGIKGKHQFDVLRNNGVVADRREPNVIRLAPVPLYNTFKDVFYLGKILEHAIHF